MITLLVIAALLAVLFGGYSYTGVRRADYGYWGWSPLGLIVLVAIVLWATGYLH